MKKTRKLPGLVTFAYLEDSAFTAVKGVASHAVVLRGARFSIPPHKGRDEKRAPLKTTAWEAIKGEAKF